MGAQEISSETLGRLLLELHSASRQLYIGDFQEWTFQLLKGTLRFDSAIWGLGSEAGEGGSFINSVHLHKQPQQLMLDYIDVKEHDPLGGMVNENPGIALNLCLADPNWQIPKHEIMRQHCIKFGLMNILCTGIIEPTSKMHNFISLYRADPADRFSKDEQAYKQLLMPHLALAYITNRAWHLLQADEIKYEKRRSWAIADGDGILHDLTPRFQAILQLEWPDWDGVKLPDALKQLCSSKTPKHIALTRIYCESHSVNDLFFLKVRGKRKADDLTPRELMIAECSCDGLSYKEIAKKLTIAPTTVRAHLRTIYLKLEVSNKLEMLAALN